MQAGEGESEAGGKVPPIGSRAARLLAFVQDIGYWRLGLLVGAGLLLGSIAALAATVQYLLPRAPDVAYLKQVRIAQPSVMLSADGSELAVFRRNQQEWISLDRISPHVVNALIATEDRRFYDHGGFDFWRTAAALVRTAGGYTQGGSTITQQLARNLFPEEIGRSRSLERKLKEIVTAVKIERAYSKQEILETYLNTVPFLYNAFGIEMAARTYYSKSAAQLGPLESATLVGMLKGTHYYNPVVNPERARTRRNLVLAQMAKQKYLPAGEVEQLRHAPLQVKFNRQIDQSSPSTHFAEHVRRWLIDWADRNDYDLYADGLVVHTTLDDALQAAALKAVARQTEALQNVADVEWGRRQNGVLSHSPSAYAQMRPKVEPFSHLWSSRPDLVDSFLRESQEYRKAMDTGGSDAEVMARLRADRTLMQRLRESKTRLEAGFVAIDPQSGEIKAWVGSRDFRKDQFDHVAQAARQPGSTFKPIVYGAAMERGFNPGRSYRDEPVAIGMPDGTLWRPADMTAPSGGAMSMREGLILSRNNITAQVMQDAGLDKIVSVARALGVRQSPLTEVPSLALGTSPVTLLEMASAYATIARAGEFRDPIPVKRITDRNGNVLAEFGGTPQRVMSESTALELIDMMRGVVSRGTGATVKSQFSIGADIAGKTGTTQNNTDGWFILMHPGLVAGSWVGFNDSRVTMRSDHWGQGGHNALLLVGDFFRTALKEDLVDAKAKFPRPRRMPLMVDAAPYAADGVQEARTQVHGSEIIVQRGPDGRTFIGDARGAQLNGWSRGATARSPEEVGALLRAMGRNSGSEGGSVSGMREERRAVAAYPQGSGEEYSGGTGALQSDGSSRSTAGSFR